MKISTDIIFCNKWENHAIKLYARSRWPIFLLVVIVFVQIKYIIYIENTHRTFWFTFNNLRYTFFYTFLHVINHNSIFRYVHNFVSHFFLFQTFAYNLVDYWFLKKKNLWFKSNANNELFDLIDAECIHKAKYLFAFLFFLFLKQNKKWIKKVLISTNRLCSIWSKWSMAICE